MNTIPQTFLERKLAEKASAEFKRESKLIKHGPRCHEIQFRGNGIIFDPTEKIRVKTRRK